MPLYEYLCTSCNERLEAIQRFSDPAYTHCPQCGGDLKKLVSSPAIQFKGSGFYLTDYGKGNSSSSTTGSKSSGAASTSESPSSGTKGSSE